MMVKRFPVDAAFHEAQDPSERSNDRTDQQQNQNRSRSKHAKNETEGDGPNQDALTPQEKINDQVTPLWR